MSARHPAGVIAAGGPTGTRRRSPGRLDLEGDTVFLDLGPAVDRVRAALRERGLTRVAAAIPPSVDERIALLRSDAFVSAQTVDLLGRLALLVPVLAVLPLAGHVALSSPRGSLVPAIARGAQSSTR